jgi:hypothetical protein
VRLPADQSVRVQFENTAPANTTLGHGEHARHISQQLVRNPYFSYHVPLCDVASVKLS